MRERWYMKQKFVIEGIMRSGTCVLEQSLPVVMKMYTDQGLLDDEANAFFERQCTGKNY